VVYKYQNWQSKWTEIHLQEDDCLNVYVNRLPRLVCLSILLKGTDLLTSSTGENPFLERRWGNFSQSFGSWSIDRIRSATARFIDRYTKQIDHEYMYL
jgi:hypothetical protein